MRPLTRDELLSRPLPTVEIPLGDGAVELAVLSVHDMEFVRSVLRQQPVEFTLSVLARQARGRLSRDELERLPRPTLLRLGRTWAADPGTLGADRSALKRFEDLHRCAARRVEEWDRTARETARRLDADLARVRIEVPEALKRALQHIGELAAEIADAASRLEPITKSVAASIRSSFPDTARIAAALAEAGQGKHVLDDHGYGFVTMDWGIPELRRIARENPTSRETHRAFLQHTRDPFFGEQLLVRVRSSRVLSRRSGILKAAIDAHLRRDYALSVPALYAQLEGVITDLLVVEGSAKRGAGGARKAGTGGKLIGLRSKAKHYGTQSSSVRHFVTQALLEDLAPERNSVLHGAKTGCRQASRSVRLLLLIDTLTSVVLSVERAGNSM